MAINYAGKEAVNLQDAVRELNACIVAPYPQGQQTYPRSAPQGT